MATYTSNYQLHQWEASDSFLRTDFNTDFQKIDAAIKGVETVTNTALAGKASTAALEAVQTLAEGKAEFVLGGYTGNGSAQIINLGFTPSAVFIAAGGYLVSITADSVFTLAEIRENGFYVAASGNSGNVPNGLGLVYTYQAFR